MKTVMFLIFIILAFILQYYFSMQKNKWLGLIIPTINILASLSAVYTMFVFLASEIPDSIFQFLSLNITTLIFFAIYYSCRKKVRQNNNNEIDKMNIQDL